MKTFLLLSLLITATLSAQDIITLKNGEEIKAKVTAVNPNVFNIENSTITTGHCIPNTNLRSSW